MITNKIFQRSQNHRPQMTLLETVEWKVEHLTFYYKYMVLLKEIKPQQTVTRYTLDNQYWEKADG